MNALTKVKSAALLILLLALFVATVEPMACLLFVVGITVGFSVTLV